MSPQNKPQSKRSLSRKRDFSTSIDTPELVAHVNAIRSLGKQTIANVISIGEHLKECKRIVGHGGWVPWLKREFAWSRQTADRFIQSTGIRAPTSWIA